MSHAESIRSWQRPAAETVTDRLRQAFFLLVAVPTVILVAGGLYIASHSRAALTPEIDRFAAQRAVQYFSHQRDSFLQELSASPAYPLNPSRLGVQQQTLYDSSGEVIASQPPGLAPLPLSPGGARTRTLFEAARRGAPVLDVAAIDGRSVWIAYLPIDGHINVALLRLDAAPLENLRRALGYDVAVYLDTGRAVSVGDGWSTSISQALLDSLASFDRPISSFLDGTSVAAIPLKDFDDWEMMGAILVRATDSAPALPGSPAWPLAGLVLAGVLTIVLSWRSQMRQTRSALRRSRLGLALLPPMIAAAWLAATDAHVSSAASDALLEMGARMAVSLVEPYGVAPAELAALVGSDVVVQRADSLIASSSDALSAFPAAREAGRIGLAGRRWAYRVADTAALDRIVLLRPPLEDSRKTVLFWLAGLYSLLAVGVLVFGSLRAASRSGLELREAIGAWSFIAPSLILLLVFSAAPLIFAFYLSFHEWNLLEPAKPFVGLRHYRELTGDGLFWTAAKNTAVYSLYVPATMALALGVAILLNRSIRGVALLRAVFFLPYITSFVAISIVWQWMYDPDFGLFNWVLGSIGLGPFPWLNSPSTALLALMLMAIWIHIGFQMVIFLAGLQAIPNELYEAAIIDGAGPWRRFQRITLPLLRPTTFFVLVTSVIGSFQVFTFVYVMTEGGPLHATDVIVYHIYQNAWQFLRMGYASAMSWVLFAVIFAITLLQFRLLGRKMTPS